MKPRILITGVSGYVGGRLRQLLETEQYPIKCLVRAKSSIPMSCPDTTRYIVGDILDKKVLMHALQDVDVAYYLVHSMGKGSDFIKVDRELAARFAESASLCKVKKIIYLGLLGNSYEEELSPHIRNRHEVGHILRANSSEVQVIELRASMVIGSGSLSFEMVRSLVDRFPLLLTPKWVRTEAQSIGIQDLLNCLVKVIRLDIEGNPIFEVGGDERVCYETLMREYAKQKGLKLWIIPIPVDATYLSSFFLALFTPLYLRVGRKLVESSICQTVVHDPLAAHFFEMKPLKFKEAIADACNNENKPAPETRWNGAASAGSSVLDWSGMHFGGRLYDVRKMVVSAKPEHAFDTVKKIGGKSGYYAGSWLFKLRGLADFLIGGVGHRRGRRDFADLRRGDVLDFWRVISYRPNQSLKLLAELKTPGRALLEFKVLPHEHGSEIQQKAMFDPIGIPGILYWYFFYPVHQYVFRRMIKGIAKKIEEQ